MLLFCLGPVVLAQDVPSPAVPDAPEAPVVLQIAALQKGTTASPLKTRPELTPAEAAEQVRLSKLPMVNGVPYDQPSTKDLTLYYVHDTYGLPGQASAVVRGLYSQIREKPEQWDFWQRFGSGEATGAINGTVRLGMELTFHEDLRYIPCPRCSWKGKIKNALLAEVTARHGEDGRRFFTLSPAISDFSGPILAHSLWYPGFDPFAGVVATRVTAAIRVGQHLGQEYLAERRYKHQPK